MIEDLVIHIGDCKTGTTSVQTVLSRRSFVADRPMVYTARFNHIPFARQIQMGYDRAAQRHARTIAKAFQKADGGIGVISAETFEFIDAQKLAAMFDGPFKPWRDKVRVIGYIRPHAERFLSTFAERSKKGGFGGQMEGLADRMAREGFLFYAPRVEAWRAAFGDRYTVRPFVRDSLLNGNVVDDVFRFIFGETLVQFTEATDQNESLSLEDLVLMRYTHKLLKKQDINLDDTDKALGWNFSPILAAHPAPRSTKLKLHKALAQKLQETYAADAAALDALAFEGTPMSDRLALAADSAVAEAQSLRPEDHHSPEVLRLVAAYTDMLGRMMAADPAHFRWATRPEAYRMPVIDQLKGELAMYLVDDSMTTSMRKREDPDWRDFVVHAPRVLARLLRAPKR